MFADANFTFFKCFFSAIFKLSQTGLNLKNTTKISPESNTVTDSCHHNTDLTLLVAMKRVKARMSVLLDTGSQWASCRVKRMAPYRLALVGLQRREKLWVRRPTAAWIETMTQKIQIKDKRVKSYCTRRSHKTFQSRVVRVTTTARGRHSPHKPAAFPKPAGLVW